MLQQYILEVSLKMWADPIQCGINFYSFHYIRQRKNSIQVKSLHVIYHCLNLRKKPIPLSCQGQPRIEDSRCIQHPLGIWLGLHWTDRPITS